MGHIVDDITRNDETDPSLFGPARGEPALQPGGDGMSQGKFGLAHFPDVLPNERRSLLERLFGPWQTHHGIGHEFPKNGGGEPRIAVHSLVQPQVASSEHALAQLFRKVTGPPKLKVAAADLFEEFGARERTFFSNESDDFLFHYPSRPDSGSRTKTRL